MPAASRPTQQSPLRFTERMAQSSDSSSDRLDPSPSSSTASTPRWREFSSRENKLFVEFCKKAAAEENINFLQLVKKYKKSNSIGRVKYYHKIAVAHLDISSSVEPVNLDAAMLRAISSTAAMCLAAGTKLPVELFDEAERFITEIVDFDLVPKFLGKQANIGRARSKSFWQ